RSGRHGVHRLSADVRGCADGRGTSQFLGSVLGALMLRNVTLLCFIGAALLFIRGGAAVLWPPFRARMDRAECQYAERLKDLFQPMGSAGLIARWQYFGSLGLVLLVFLLTRNPVFSIAVPLVGFTLPGFIFARLRKERLEKINQQLPDTLRV